MSNIRLLVADYLWELYATKNLAERFQVYDKYIRLLGFDSAIYMFIPKIVVGETTLPVISFQTNEFPKDFLSSRIEDDLLASDCNLRNIFNGSKSVIDWKDCNKRGIAYSDKAKIIKIFREEYGLTNGICIPLMSNIMGDAGVGVSSKEEDRAFSRLKNDSLEALIHCTRAFHDACFHEVQHMPIRTLKHFADLTEKEQGLLRHLASGKPLKNIEYSIDVASYGVAANMLNNIRDRFGKKVTRDQLMYLTGLLDGLSPHEVRKK